MIYRFEEFELDDELFQIRRRGTRLAVQPKVLDVVLLLLRNRDRVVSKRELHAELWPGVTVAEASVTQAVMLARRMLDDDGDAQRVVETVRGRGYRFVARLAEPHATRPPPPSGAAPPASASWSPGFVGRDAEMALLEQTLEATLGGVGAVALIAGAPGMGKTRLLDELARVAGGRGVDVLAARCHEGDAVPALWPWQQILRAYGAARDPGLSLPAGIFGAEPGFQALDDYTRFFAAASSERPLLVALDDLHHAAPSALLLFELFARAVKPCRVLLVGAYRDPPAGPVPVARMFGALEAPSRSLRLRGLAREDVARFVARTTSREPASEMVDSLMAKTAGIPLFVTQLVQAAARAHPGDAGSQSSLLRNVGVREAIGIYLETLSDECRRALAIGAVLGDEFALAPLAAATGLAPAVLLETLSMALGARILLRPPHTVGVYRFCHSLMRGALYGDLSASARARAHAAVGEALVAHYGAQLDAHVDEVAHHFLQAAAVGDVARAVQYADKAAEQASRRGAHDEAALHYERALQAMDLGRVDDAARLRALFSLGEARERSGDLVKARDAFELAATMARALGAGTELARAALKAAGETEVTAISPSRAALLTDALAQIGETADPVSALVMARLASALVGLGQSDRARLLVDRALALARASGDAAALATVTAHRHFVLAAAESR